MTEDRCARCGKVITEDDGSLSFTLGGQTMTFCEECGEEILVKLLFETEEDEEEND